MVDKKIFHITLKYPIIVIVLTKWINFRLKCLNNFYLKFWDSQIDVVYLERSNSTIQMR